MNFKVSATPALTEDLASCIRRALELGLSLGNSADSSCRSTVIDAVATKIGALAWLWKRGEIASGDGDIKPEWTSVVNSQLFPATNSSGSSLCKFLQESAKQSANAERTIRHLQTIAMPSECSKWHTITCFELHSSMTLDLIQFIRPISHNPFTECDRVFVNIVLDCLTQKEQLLKRDDSSHALTEGLAKRQREVLHLLLSGKSLKEIATILGISHHTVNDYSKSLYRHFEVHSRAELAAHFRNQSELQASIDA